MSLSIIEIVSEFDIEARTKNYTKKFEDGQTKTDGTKNNQMILGRLKKLVNAALQEGNIKMSAFR